MTQKVLSFTLFLVALFTQQNGYAYDFEVNGIYYSILSLPDLTVSVTQADGEGANYTGTIKIPDKIPFREYVFDVIEISDYAFSNSSIVEVNIPMSITKIGTSAFSNCKLLEKITIPESVTSIGTWCFASCSSLKYISLPSNLTKIPDYTFRECSQLQSLDIPNEVTLIGEKALENCTSIQTLVVPDKVSGIGDFCMSGMSSLNSLTLGKKCYSLGQYSLSGLSSLKSLIIAKPDEIEYPYTISIWMSALNSPLEYLYLGKQLSADHGSSFNATVTLKNLEFATSSIHKDFSFYRLTNLESISFGTMKDINKTFVNQKAMRKVYCHSAEPPTFSAATDKNVFSSSTYLDGILYVPAESIQLYKKADGWGNFWNIQALSEDGAGEETPKCAKPHISYNNGKLTFISETEGAICYSNITNSDITSYIGDEVQLTVTYNISVYATKDGYENSDVATATLCWIDVEPKTEGITDGIVQMPARAVMVKAEGGQLTVEGAEDNTIISAYSIDGVQAGTTSSRNGVASIYTAIPKDSVTIVKIGNKSVKVIMR